jgi:hypothetical protein
MQIISGMGEQKKSKIYEIIKRKHMETGAGKNGSLSRQELILL